MTETEWAKKREELDRELNDPDIPMNPARVQELLADLHYRKSGSNGHNQQMKLRRDGWIPREAPLDQRNLAPAQHIEIGRIETLQDPFGALRDHRQASPRGLT